MTESPRRDGAEPTQQRGNNYQGPPDPAYANQPPYGPPYQPPAAPNPTERLSPYYQYGQYGYDPYATGQYGPGYPPGAPQQPPPEGPKSPMWLWVLAGAVVLLVVALVIALVIANSSRQQTVVAPAPSMPEPTATTSPRPTTPTRTPTPVVPLPTTPPSSAPPTSAPSGTTETVTYDVIGEGRVINITYTDTGGVPQTEFNVALPWSKQVELPSPARSSARISIINVGRDVTCSVAINGAQIQQNTGSGLTFCVGMR
ncbi:MmpS family transport accessory protein [Mycolicibacterium baixiangningiae]|uniref:MmpS family transport accessory protein n=1 Tax=Mycolicibacterium baixiangningiae TaxID=2761578 RepID=UPI00186802FA|nr:MmpS family transport accessory protein [Mycolicibacterium baixiangningiae]